LEPTRRARKDIRYPLEAPVSFSWKDVHGVHHCEGQTYDISDKGAFVFSSVCPPPLTKVVLKISIPAVLDSSRVLMEVEGRVLRVEESGGKDRRNGFAVLSSQAILHQNAREHREADPISGGIN
jgi:PilZ domain